MAATVTTLSANYVAGSRQITLTAYTAPAGRAKPILKVDDELFLIVDTSASPTLGVVPGYMGTLNVRHSINNAAVYGAPADMQDVKGPNQSYESLTTPTIAQQSLEVTATGTTGSNAANITVQAPGLLNVTGVSGTGLNLPFPTVGAEYTIFNESGTGSYLIFCTASGPNASGVITGATINGNAGATGYSLTATGNRVALAICTTIGAWQIRGNT